MKNNYLMHYGTKGMKWGHTKHPGEYTPTGKRAQLRQNTIDSQFESQMRSRMSPWKAARYDSITGGLYYKGHPDSDVSMADIVRANHDPAVKNKIGYSYKKAIKNSLPGFVAGDIADRAKRTAEKGRDIADFVVEDNIDRAKSLVKSGKKLVKRGKKKVRSLLRKFF